MKELDDIIAEFSAVLDSGQKQEALHAISRYLFLEEESITIRLDLINYFLTHRRGFSEIYPLIQKFFLKLTESDLQSARSFIVLLDSHTILPLELLQLIIKFLSESGYLVELHTFTEKQIELLLKLKKYEQLLLFISELKRYLRISERVELIELEVELYLGNPEGQHASLKELGEEIITTLFFDKKLKSRSHKKLSLLRNYRSKYLDFDLFFLLCEKQEKPFFKALFDRLVITSNTSFVLLVGVAGAIYFSKPRVLKSLQNVLDEAIGAEIVKRAYLFLLGQSPKVYQSLLDSHFEYESEFQKLFFSKIRKQQVTPKENVFLEEDKEERSHNWVIDSETEAAKLYEQIMALILSKEVSSAIHILKKFFSDEKNLQQVDLLYLLADLLVQEESFGEAINYASAGLILENLSENDRVAYEYLLAESYRGLGQFKRAYQSYVKVQNDRPSYRATTLRMKELEIYK